MIVDSVAKTVSETPSHLIGQLTGKNAKLGDSHVYTLVFEFPKNKSKKWNLFDEDYTRSQCEKWLD
jgi:hypothetical protein